MKSTLSLLARILFILFLGACDPLLGFPTEDKTPQVLTPNPVADGNIIVVTPIYDGPNQTHLTIGQVLVVQIPTIAQEGFEWVLLDYDPKITLLEREATFIKDEDPEAAGGVTEFIFAVVGNGVSNLSFDYQNKAQGVSSNSYGLTVIVSDGIQNFVLVTPDPGGSQIARLKVGEMLVVELPTIPEEGFDWVVPYLDTAILVQIGQAEYIADKSEDSVGGVTQLQFEAVGSGETQLALEYAKISEDLSQIVTKGSFGMTVIVD